MKQIVKVDFAGEVMVFDDVALHQSADWIYVVRKDVRDPRREGYLCAWHKTSRIKAILIREGGAE